MLEKAKTIQGQNDTKDIEAKRHMIEKAKIEALIEKHRLHTPKTPDEGITRVQAKMPKIRVKRGPKKVNPHMKRQQRISKLKSPTKREQRP